MLSITNTSGLAPRYLFCTFAKIHSIRSFDLPRQNVFILLYGFSLGLTSEMTNSNPKYKRNLHFSRQLQSGFEHYDRNNTKRPS